MNAFSSKKAILWSVGVFLILAGAFAAAVVLPSASEPYGSGAPDVHLPAMKNAPENPGTHKLQLDVQNEEPAE